ncbi:MAG: hypothetical protein U0800_23945 [Isosphaeraceae bacterium]
MFLLDPSPSPDRPLLSLAAPYLAVGIPIEEIQRIRLFGQESREYGRRVPAPLPTGSMKADRGRDADASSWGHTRDWRTEGT